jgi:hypothetical protein
LCQEHPTGHLQPLLVGDKGTVLRFHGVPHALVEEPPRVCCVPRKEGRKGRRKKYRKDGMKEGRKIKEGRKEQRKQGGKEENHTMKEGTKEVKIEGGKEGRKEGTYLPMPWRSSGEAHSMKERRTDYVKVGL